MSKKIYIESIELWNLKGFEHFQAKLGAVTVITGTHGSGKTSFTMGVEMFFEAGGDPSLIRTGCNEAKGRITFSNGYSAVKVVKKDGATLEVFNPEGGICKAPATIIKNLLPRNAFDPTPFLDSFDATKRAEFILEHLPISFTVEEINSALSVKLGKLEIDGVHLLEAGPDKSAREFDDFYKEVYSARTAINTKIDNLEGANRTLEGSLPQDDGIVWTTEADRIQTDLSAVETAIATAESKVKLEAEQARSENLKKFDRNIAHAKESIATYVQRAEKCAAMVRAFADSLAHTSEQIASIRAITQPIDCEDFINEAMAVRRLEAERSVVLAKIDKAENETLTEVRAENSEARTKLSVELGEAKQKAREQERGKGVKMALDEARIELKGEVVRYEYMTAVLESLRRVKGKKMKAVAIPGFDIRFEKAKGARTESVVILINDLPLDDLNRQQALYVVIKLLCLAQKANTSEEIVPLLIFEARDLLPSYIEDLKVATTNAEMQLVITVAKEDSALMVETA